MLRVIDMLPLSRDNNVLIPRKRNFMRAVYLLVALFLHTLWIHFFEREQNCAW